MRIVRYAALLAVLAGCYNPVAREGAPCERSDRCPAPQRCVLGQCSLGEAPEVDASPPVMPDASPDAPVDAPPPPIDAMRLPCNATGLSCSGTATTFTCGGNCWVMCTANVPRETARAGCAGWMGVPGEINDAIEEGCVTPHVSAAAWIGLVQSATATRPGDGWTWNGTTPVTYTNWLAGKPDDGDNRESGAEQCASIRTNGTWDDDACNTPLDFLCERP
jgi:hypothetical protein